MVWLCVDIDELPILDRQLSGFGHNRRAMLSVADRDHAGEFTGSIREKLTQLIAREGITETLGQVDLITLPKLFGYAFNPVSFYRCCDAQDQFTMLIAEVRNTFGEVHHYVLRPESTPTAGQPVRFACDKAFFVSPFNRVEGEYTVRWLEEGDSLSIEIDLWRNGKLVFTAGMGGELSPLTSHKLFASGARLMVGVLTVTPRITWQAIVLHIRKRVPIFAKPVPVSGATIPAKRLAIVTRIRREIVGWLSRRQNRPASKETLLSIPTESAS